MNFKKKLGPEHESTETEENDNQEILVKPEESWAPNTLKFFGESSRTILLTGVIDADTANCFISQLLELDAQSDELIWVYVNTPGGSINNAFAIYDTLRMIAAPVVGLVIGECMSAGLLILQAMDLRLSSPNALFLYHEPVFEGFSAETASAMNQSNLLYQDYLKRIENIIIKRAKINQTTWKKVFAGKETLFISANQAKDYHLVDDILEPTKVKPLKLDYKKAV